jgi:hypothetical protein
MIKALYFETHDKNTEGCTPTGGTGGTVIINNHTTQINNNQYVTVVQHIKNFTGDVINTVVNVTNNIVTNMVVNWATWNITDYHVTTINNTQVFQLYETVNNMTVTVTYHNVFVENINSQIKGGFRNTEEAISVGKLKAGDMYYLLQDNDPSQYSGVVVFIA